MSKTIKSAIILLLLILPLALSCNNSISDNQTNSPAKGIDLVDEAWKAIDEDFVNSSSLQDDQLAEGAIRGLVESLNNPYSAYFNAEQYQSWKTKLAGEFSGIGATIAIKDGQLTVIAPIAGSPAEKADIRPGDKILEVDGKPTAKMSLQEAMLEIRGEKGTRVKLLVLHLDQDTPIEIEITRDDIELKSVEWKMLPGNIAHIKITSFSDLTDSEFASALKDIGSQNAAGIVLDLRDNPGGIVNTAVDVVDQFIQKGIVLYALDNRGKRTDWSAKDGGLAKDIPLAVLVNGNSASASEVVSGALQDYNRGPIIGVKTFGKGSVNHIRPLSNGGALYITYALWYTPNGRQIEGKGIIPDIIVEMTPEDTQNNRDPQLERAIEYLQHGK
ncbi:MAG: S41 family peptidase [Dehalococcoidia bacterium]